MYMLQRANREGALPHLQNADGCLVQTTTNSPASGIASRIASGNVESRMAFGNLYVCLACGSEVVESRKYHVLHVAELESRGVSSLMELP